MLLKQAGVLLIDPIQIVRNQTFSVLNTDGVNKVTLLESPPQALELLETKPCHLILTEFHCDGPLSGLEFLTTIRNHAIPRVRNICFVFLTAEAKKDSAVSAMLAGADDYILKPLTSNQIQSRVTSLLMKIRGDQ